ncbi:MAG: erythromycin esterase family protein [Gammaproteobacteria bacterium]
MKLGAHTRGFPKIEAKSFSFLDEALTDVRVVGYGEDTHGTADFTLLAQTLMQYLAQRHGFTVFIIETGFGEGQYLNDYIHGKRDDLTTILADHNSTWRYNTQEFHQLMYALREHNQRDGPQVHLYGSEMQYVKSDVDRIRAFLKRVDSDYQIDGFEKHLWQPFEESDKSDYYISYMKLKAYFIEHGDTFKEKTSKQEYELAYRHVEVLGQFVAAINQNVEQRKHDLRDLYMAENIQWILDHHGEAPKALYWAHNAHVGDWVSNGIVDVAGHQLRKVYEDAYFNIATDFGSGEFMAFSQDWKMQSFGHASVPKDTFSACLQRFGEPNTFLNIRDARKKPALTTYLNAPVTTVSGAGAQFRDAKTETSDLTSAFDGLIYLDKTTAISMTD